MIALATAAAIVAIPKTSFADEGGVSFWLPGLFGSLAAAPQQPGWSFAAINYYTNVSASGAIAASREVTIGKLNPAVNVNLNVNLHAQADLVLLNPTYVFATPVFGGQLAVSMMGIVGTNHVDLDGTITAGVRVQAGQSRRYDNRIRRSLSGSVATLEQRCQQLHGLRDWRHPSWEIQFNGPG
jgi:hypothetical protein